MITTGDLVSVTETRGIGGYSKKTPMGLGIVLEVNKTKDVDFGLVGLINLGDDITVVLTSGTLQTFNEKSVEVVNASL